MSSETYLGDGLYASFDGWQIKLCAPHATGNHEVYLEPSVIEAFERYVAQLRSNAQSESVTTNGE